LESLKTKMQLFMMEKIKECMIEQNTILICNKNTN
jgi:hypothetical protein